MLKSFSDKSKDFIENFKNRPKVHRSTFVLPLKTLGESFQGKVYNFNVQPLYRPASRTSVPVKGRNARPRRGCTGPWKIR